MAHILWFSKFWNLIGESVRDLSSLLNDYGEDRIKKIKQGAAKCMQRFQGIKVDNPTVEADCFHFLFLPHALHLGVGAAF